MKPVRLTDGTLAIPVTVKHYASRHQLSMSLCSVMNSRKFREDGRSLPRTRGACLKLLQGDLKVYGAVWGETECEASFNIMDQPEYAEWEDEADALITRLFPEL